MALTDGDMLPDVAVTTPDERVARLSEWAGRPLVVYFYPKDDTPGCTNEAKDFSAAMSDFDLARVTVVGISKDSPAKHRKFAAKHDLSVQLLTDADDSVTEAFGVWVEKNMYGKKYMGIDRSTFLFDADFRLVRQWRKVRVPGHVAEVLAAARDL